MELQNIHLSILFILLPDYLLHLLRMIGIMSSPIHDHYRCTPTRRTQNSLVRETEKSRMIDSPANEKAAGVFLLWSTDVALHQCTTKQKPTTPNMTSIQFGSGNAPSFCCFFIDMQPHFDFDSCQQQSTYKDMSGEPQMSINPLAVDSSDLKLQRQRSISECSDDSFIFFEDDDGDMETSTFDQTDLNASHSVADCSNDSQDSTKKVRFNLKPKIHVMHAWNFAYRAARKGCWQEIARDRDRFQQRIKRAASILNVVLSPNHREKIYKDRFLDVK